MLVASSNFLNNQRRSSCHSGKRWEFGFVFLLFFSWCYGLWWTMVYRGPPGGVEEKRGVIEKTFKSSYNVGGFWNLS